MTRVDNWTATTCPDCEYLLFQNTSLISNPRYFNNTYVWCCDNTTLINASEQCWTYYTCDLNYIYHSFQDKSDGWNYYKPLGTKQYLVFAYIILAIIIVFFISILMIFCHVSYKLGKLILFRKHL